MSACTGIRHIRDERQYRGRLVARLMARALDARQPPVDLTSEDLQAIQPLLVTTGAGPLAWWALRNTARADDSRAQALRDLFLKQAQRVAAATQDLQMLLDACRRHHVDPVIGKGWAVARWYPAQGLRPCDHFDLYAPSSDFAGLVDVAMVLTPHLQSDVELHRGGSHLDDREFTVLRAHSQLVQMGRTQVRVYGTEDALRMACVRLLVEGAMRPPWLCDVAAILGKLPDGFDWEYFASGDPRRTEWAFVALGLAHEVLGADTSRVPPWPSGRVHLAGLAEAVFTLWGGTPPSTTKDTARDSPGSANAVLLSSIWKKATPIEATPVAADVLWEAPRLPGRAHA